LYLGARNFSCSGKSPTASNLDPEMPSAWEKSLRRSDVTDHAAVKANAAAAAKEKVTKASKMAMASKVAAVTKPMAAGRRSIGVATEVWPVGDKVKGAGAVAAGVKPPRVTRQPKLSLIDEEDVFHEIFGEENVTAAAAAKGKPLKRGGQNQKKPRRLSSVDNIPGNETRQSVGPSTAAGAGAGRAPVKTTNKQEVLCLPLTPNPDFLSPVLSPSAAAVSPFPLPPEVICIDGEVQVAAYAAEGVAYEMGRDARYAQAKNFCHWKLKNVSKSRSASFRQTLMDWIIEVIHYFKGSQYTLYQTVHIIDRYVYNQCDIMRESQVQLVGCAAVLIATKLEEYYAVGLEQLESLTANSLSASKIQSMELKLLASLDFVAYSLDPMVFLNRFMLAAAPLLDPAWIAGGGDAAAAVPLREKMLREAAIFFLDATITDVDLWSVATAKKCAAAVYAALALIPPLASSADATAKEQGEEEKSDESNSSSSDGEEDSPSPSPLSSAAALHPPPMWTPTLAYYSGYDEGQIALLARQMIGVLEKCVASVKAKAAAAATAKAGGGNAKADTSIGDDDKNVGICHKYLSVSRHDAFLKSIYCSTQNIEKAVQRLSQDSIKSHYKFTY